MKITSWLLLLLFCCACSKNGEVEPQNFLIFRGKKYPFRYGFFSQDGGRYARKDFAEFSLFNGNLSDLDGNCGECDLQIVSIELYSAGPALNADTYFIEEKKGENGASVTMEIAERGVISDFDLKSGTVELGGTKPNFTLKLSGITYQDETVTAQYLGQFKELL